MKNIMLVDDSTTVLLSISTILQKAGFSTRQASNAEDALQEFKQGFKPDLLITDLHMPGMNGIEFIREVRKLSTHKFMPILFLTTESQQEKRQERLKTAFKPEKAQRAKPAEVIPLRGEKQEDYAFPDLSDLIFKEEEDD